MLVFNLGFLPNIHLASAGYGCSGCCAKNANGNCVPNDEECACWQKCDSSCSCSDITNGLGACEYFDSCQNGFKLLSPGTKCDYCGSDNLCHSGDDPGNQDCSNTYNSTCVDQTALCHVTWQCS